VDDGTTGKTRRGRNPVAESFGQNTEENTMNSESSASNTPELPGNRLVPLRALAQAMSMSERELRRNIPDWPGFPELVDLGHRKKVYSYDAFQSWLKDFIKKKTEKSKDTP
jgi:hypothetical protein